MDSNDVWVDYGVEVYNPDIDMHVPLCGLCGNRGTLDTRLTTFPPTGGPPMGVLAYCICPNGQAMKGAKSAVIAR